jgi:hypothetical protein
MSLNCILAQIVKNAYLSGFMRAIKNKKKIRRAFNIKLYRKHIRLYFVILIII